MNFSIEKLWQQKQQKPGKEVDFKVNFQRVKIKGILAAPPPQSYPPKK